jgi:hypothetical protein
VTKKTVDSVTSHQGDVRLCDPATADEVRGMRSSPFEGCTCQYAGLTLLCIHLTAPLNFVRSHAKEFMDDMLRFLGPAFYFDVSNEVSLITISTTGNAGTFERP